MTEDKPTLKQCPFCGESEVRVVFNLRTDSHFVACEICEAKGAECFLAKEAINAWNERADLT